ncbi:MAG: hypothetical protein HC819_23545 [Cyclobacteriaceae bacterium]|nr:hypothetical protein [Cyclobacteriaceae bacterium]
MIPKIHSKSLVSDINSIATSIVNDFDKRSFADDAFMTLQIDKLKDYTAQMVAALNEREAESILAPLDKKRDELLRVIFREVKAKSIWPDEAISSAAAIVAAELDKYDSDIIVMPYGMESANINAMLQDFKKAEVVAAMKTLSGLSELVVQLDAAQRTFEAAYLQFIDQRIESKKYLSATVLGRLLTRQINNEIALYLNAMSKARPDTFAACAEVVKMIIENSNAKVKNRNKKPDEEQSDI